MQYNILREWENLLERLPANSRDIYFSEAYVRLYETEKKEASCAVCVDDDTIMLMPFLRSSIGGYYDFETAYGYGGPIANTDNENWQEKAFLGLYDYLKQEGYICGLIRFHPLLRNFMISEVAFGDGNLGIEDYGREISIMFDRQTVVVDTRQSIEDIWHSQISSKNRNMIRKAEKNHLVYKAEYDFASLEEFCLLYKETMERLHADPFYFFDSNYFENLKTALTDHSFLGTVRKDGELICAAIIMYSNYYGHYHLQGNNRKYASLGAGNYLLWKVVCEMHDMGIEAFHLGGGTTASTEDSLFKFKKAFSGNVESFFIGKEIFNIPLYHSLCAEWERENVELKEQYGKYLLRYRYGKEIGDHWRGRSWTVSN